ncbi:MAG: cache domain-containing protein [Rubrivivax sp.]|nr:cache domain-containing protein [Rubrivivax sp.]
MNSTNSRMVVVAVVVCAFAVGMSGLLNYFKYRSTTNRLVAERLVVTAKSVENSIQSALELGLQFADIATLPSTLDRERASDDLIDGIDVFDMDGQLIYSTDRRRVSQRMPELWQTQARKEGGEYWFVQDAENSAAGIPIKNNFGLVIGYLALRYSADQVNQDALAIGSRLALVTALVFVLSAALTAAALIAVVRRLDRDVAQVEQALRAGEGSQDHQAALRGPFGKAMQQYLKTATEVDTRIVELRTRLERGQS